MTVMIWYIENQRGKPIYDDKCNTPSSTDITSQKNIL